MNVIQIIFKKCLVKNQSIVDINSN